MTFRYQPQWQGPLSGRSFEKQTEDAINALDSRIEEIGGCQIPSDAIPSAPGIGSPGTMTEYSRGDHQHPRQDITNELSDLESDIKEWVNGSDSNVVHLSGDEAISGAKTFEEGPYGTTSAVSAATIDLSDGCVFTKTITANTTFAITGLPTDAAATFNLVLTNAGSYTITWPQNVEWGDDTPPDLTPIGLDVLTFMTPDGGVHWYGVVALSGLPDATGQTAYARANDLITRAQIDSLFSEGA